MKVTVGVLVKGKVQGVYYRQSTREQAMKIGVTGFVQNLKDGDVYLVAQGTEDQLQKLFIWCKRGPLLARVDSISQERLSDQPEYTSFEIRK